MQLKKTRTFLLMALLSLTLLTGCRLGNPVQTPSGTFTSTAEAMKLEDVRKLIMQGCVDAGWTPISLSTPVVEARIVVRGKHTAVVEIPYTQTHYSIQYKNSINLEHKRSNDGTHIIHPNYNNWVARLNSAINKRLMERIVR